jgi:hypothetical protein
MLVGLRAVVAANVVLLLLALALGEQPESAFGESGFVTDIHVLVLFLAAAFAGLTFRARRASRSQPEGGRRRLWAAPELFWAIVAAAFVYLALDESARIHEGLDKRFHEYVLGHAATAMSTRLDDALVGLYALGALGLCWHYRTEVLRVPALARVLVVALALLLVDVVIDLLHHDDVLKMLTTTYRERVRLHSWLTVVEESIKVLSGSLFCFGFYLAWRAAVGETPPAEPHRRSG